MAERLWVITQPWLAVTSELSVFFLAWEVLYRLVPPKRSFWISILRPSEQLVYGWELPAWLLSTAIALFLVFPLLRVVFGRWRLIDFGLTARSTKESLLSSAVICALWVCGSNIAICFTPLPSLLTLYGASSAEDFRLLAIMSPLVFGLGEEIVYRGYVQSAFTGFAGAWGQLIGAILFSLSHVPEARSSAFVGGLFCAVLYSRTGWLLPVVLAHTVFDASYFGEFYAIQTGSDSRAINARGCRHCIRRVPDTS